MVRRSIIAASAFLLAQCGARTGMGFDDDGSSPDGAADAKPVSDACVARTLTLEVPITQPWVATGLSIVAGSRLVVVATGTVHYGGGPQQVGDANGTDYPQKFFSTSVLPNTIAFTLIGKVGGTLATNTGTPVPEGVPGSGAGFVGASYDEIATASGPLFLGYNDQLDWFYDNVGSFTVTITSSCR